MHYNILYYIYYIILIRNILKEVVLSFKEKGKVVLLGDFNARVGSRSVQIDDVIGMFGEDICNASGNRLLSF